MKIHESIIREKNKRVYTADDYRLPTDTLGNPPKRVKKALDNSFDAVRSVLSHSLENLADTAHWQGWRRTDLLEQASACGPMR